MSKNRKYKNTGLPYELFVRDLYTALCRDDRFATVEHDIMLPGRDGERQVDVLIRTTVASHNLLIVIECRDYASRLGITHLDAFHSKLQDINASKGILVSRRGFSRNAQSKAQRVGITLCLASTAHEVLKEINVTVPVRANEILATFDAEMRINITHAGQSISSREVMTINGVHLQERLHEELVSQITDLPTETSTRKWFPSNIAPPFYVRDTEGKAVKVENISINAKFLVRYYFGHLEDVPGLSAMHELQTGKTTLFLGQNEVPNLLSTLTEFRHPHSIPKIYRLTINVIHVEERTIDEHKLDPTRR